MTRNTKWGCWVIVIAVIAVATGIKLRRAYATIRNGFDSARTELTEIRVHVDRRIIESQLTALKSELEQTSATLKSELEQTRGEIAEIKIAIPPHLDEARHIQVRKISLYSQVAQIDKQVSLIVGDSITEGLYLPRLNETQVLNGGIGGAGIMSIETLLDEFRPRVRFAKLLIAIGVNDATRRAVPRNYYVDWEKSYVAVIKRAQKLAIMCAVSTVIPVETGKPVGDSYFDPDVIAHVNSIIRRLARTYGVVLIDNDVPFRQLTARGESYTVDGVHLNAKGYELWKHEIIAALAPR